MGYKRVTTMKTRKSWREKLLGHKGLPRVIQLEGRSAAQWGEGTMVIPAPMEVKKLMDKIQPGQLTTINELRGALAQKHQTTVACPITTGIFALIAAHAAEESAAQGEPLVTPYWRTLKNGGELNPKYPGGVDVMRQRLEAEGHRVEQRGQRWFVAEPPPAQPAKSTQPAKSAKSTKTAKPRKKAE